MNGTPRPPVLIILMYHAVVRSPLTVPDWCFLDAQTFRRHMEAVSATGRVRGLSAAARSLAEGSADGPVIAVTFDDGFLNNYTVAFPVLERLNVPATVFLNTAFVDSPDTVWFCRVNQAVSETKLTSVVWHGQTYDLSTTEARSESSAQLQARLKEYPHPELLRELQALGRDLKCGVDSPVSVMSPYALLNSESIHRMSASGLIEFGAHTHSHAILSLLSPEHRQSEIIRSVLGVRALGIRACDVFAYPNGRRQDYTADVFDTLHSVGVRTAVTAIHGVNDESTPPMELRRFGIGSNISVAEFEEVLANASR